MDCFSFAKEEIELWVQSLDREDEEQRDESEEESLKSASNRLHIGLF